MMCAGALQMVRNLCCRHLPVPVALQEILGTIGWIPSAQMGGKCWRGWKTTCQGWEYSWQEPFGLNKAFAGRLQSPSGHCKTWGWILAWGQLGDKCLLHVGWVLLLHPAPCAVRTHGFGQLEHRNIRAPLCLPGLRAVNVLCSGWGGRCPPRAFVRLDFTEEEEKGWNCL